MLHVSKLQRAQNYVTFLRVLTRIVQNCGALWTQICEVWSKDADLIKVLQNDFYSVFILVLQVLMCIPEKHQWFYLEDLCEISNFQQI